MTNEMKENIIKYLTGNITEESYNPDLIYSNVKTITSDLDNQLSAMFTDGYSAIGIVQGKNIKGNSLNYSVLYGTYESNSNTYGFVAIIDEYGTLVQVITEFTSGVKIGEIYTLNVDEEGFFFMVEYGVESNNKRFVMLNNIVIKAETDLEYIVKIRKAYAIPNTTLIYSGSIYNIVKSAGQARYMIFGTGIENIGGADFLIPIGTELVINVGAENEWNDYKGTVYNDGSNHSVSPIATYATWNQDTITFIVITQAYINDEEVILKYTKSGSTMAYTRIPITITNAIGLWGENSVILNDTKGYLAYTAKYSGNVETHYLMELNFTTNTATEIFDDGGYTYDLTGMEELPRFNLLKVDNEVFFSGFKETDYDDVTHKYIWTISVGRIRNDAYYTNQVSSYDLTTYEPTTGFQILFVNRQFNYYNFNVLLENTTYNCYQIYNANNYNGQSVEGTKSLLPNSGILYDDNGDIIFARNLYNKVISGGTTTSTLEVPNQFINNITIAQQDLYSFNNNLLINNSEDIITNQYETLNINFINEISMINENDINNPILSPLGASRLNNSISNDVDYANACLNKIRLNYSDSSAYVKPINNATQVSTYVYQYQFSVYVPLDKTILSIDLLSNDGNTIYTSIDTSSLSKGITYEISQNVEIQ